MTGYRAEIDGLRAIAIILVILFHLTFTSLGMGGYIGVDVFFVISGYLITGHLRNDLRSGLSGMLEFYRRRVIRIFPALFAIYLACIIFEVSVRFIAQLPHFRNVLISSVFFASNFYLYETTGYFDFRSRTNSLIHTWSLSIEEQYYILLPLILYLFAKRAPRWQVLWLAALTVVSLIAAQMLLAVDTRLSFYLVPLRAWELLAGSLLSYRTPQALRSRWLAEGIGTAGLLIILYSARQLNPSSPFPGFAALPAVVGTVMILVATEGRTTLLQRALASPPMRFVGQISYSLYLWHWPLIVYSRYLLPLNTPAQKALLIAISIVAATISWWLIEQPVRKRGRQISKKLALSSAAIAMIVITALGLLMPRLSRMAWKDNPKAEAILRIVDNYDVMSTWRSGRCFLPPETVGQAKLAPECFTMDANRPNVLLIGDSHAAMLWWGLDRQFRKVNFLQATIGSCDPFNHYRSPYCAALMGEVIDGFLGQHMLDAVIVSIDWKPGDEQRIGTLIAKLHQHARTVVVFGPNASYELPFPEIAARAIYSGNQSDLKRYEQPEASRIDSMLGPAVIAAGGRYVSIYRTMCRQACWVLGRNGMPVTYDSDHLSYAGSEMLAASLPPGIFNLH